MKLDSGFGLDNAGWPAFLVDDSGIVRHANQAAVNAFGTVMEGEPSLSASVWSTKTDMTPEESLAKFTPGGGKGGAESGGNRAGPGRLQPAGKGPPRPDARQSE